MTLASLSFSQRHTSTQSSDTMFVKERTSLLTPDIDFPLDTVSQLALSLFNTLKATTSKPTRQMPKRTFDTMANEDAASAVIQASFVAKLAVIQAELVVEMSSIEIESMRRCIYLFYLNKYGEGINRAVPMIQALARGMLTRRRVHCALLSADPDALAMAM
jgi:hypothetical protein